jgi:hypothetical protein
LLDQPTPQLPAAGQPFNVMQAIIGVIRQPVPTLREIATVRPWLMALIIASGVRLLQYFIVTFTYRVTPPLTYGSYDGLVRLIDLFEVGFTILPLWVAFLAGIFWLVGRLLGGRGASSAVFSTLGFSTVPDLFSTAVNFGVWLVASTVLPVVALGVFAWVMVLGTIGVRESMAFSTGRAAATVLISLTVLTIVGLIVFISIFSPFSVMLR